MAVFNFLWQGSWALDTNGLDGTNLIAASFKFRAYFLHPAVKSAFQTVRAYRAWRAIEKHQIVKVTKYSLAAEILRGRGRWDAERITTVILAVFSLAYFGLELSVGLAYCEGDADILHRPPPVVFHKCAGGDGMGHWQVSHCCRLCFVINADIICQKRLAPRGSAQSVGLAPCGYDVRMSTTFCFHSLVIVL